MDALVAAGWGEYRRRWGREKRTRGKNRSRG
jgi:hypothetical protein